MKKADFHEIPGEEHSQSKKAICPLLEKEYWQRFNLVYIVLLYFLFACIVTYPLIFNLSAKVIGNPYTDLSRSGLFSFWWVTQNLKDMHIFPLFVNLLNHPWGGFLYPPDPLSALMGVFLNPFFHFPASYNLIFFFNLVGGALATYFLVYYLTKSKPGAFVSGALMGFAPCMIAVYVDGVSEFGHFMWIPLYLIYLYRAYDQDNVDMDTLLGCGILLFMTSFANWYYGIFALLLTALIFFQKLLIDPETRREKMLMVKKTLVAGFAAFVLIFPFAMAQFLSVSWGWERKGTSEASLFLLDKSALSRTLTMKKASADLFDFFVPDNEYNREFPYYYIVYPGYIALILSLTGLLIHIKDRSALFWAFTGFLFFILCLGPVLFIGGKVHPFWALLNKKYLLPFGLLCKIFPGFKYSNHPFRFAIVLSLSLAVLSGFGVSHLVSRIRESFKKTIVCIGIACLIIAEYLILSPLPFPLPSMEVNNPPLLYKVLARDRDNFSIIDVPFKSVDDVEKGIRFPSPVLYMRYLPIHKKAIPYTIDAIHPAHIINNTFMERLKCISDMEGIEEEVANPYHLLNPDIPGTGENWAAISRDISRLKALHYRYVILHRSYIANQAMQEKLESFLGACLGEPIKEEERWIYILR